MTDTLTLSLDEARTLAEAACRKRGASPDVAAVLADATVEAEAAGNTAVGFAHLLDYLDALATGRINGGTGPAFDHPAPAVIRADARGGVAQLGFARARTDLAERARRFGLALFLQHGSYTTGELGWYVRALAVDGLVGYAVTNGPALMRPPGAARNVYCTNPVAFAVPGPDGPCLLIDQSSSATAYVALRQAAQGARPIPEGWAVDENGLPTTDAAAGLRGALLTFGGERGANIALMVEMLAGGIAGGAWGLDAPAFDKGTESPAAGLLVLAIAPAVLGDGVSARMAAQVDRLAREGVHIPGRRKRTVHDGAARQGLRIDAAVVAAVKASAEG